MLKARHPHRGEQRKAEAPNWGSCRAKPTEHEGEWALGNLCLNYGPFSSRVSNLNLQGGELQGICEGLQQGRGR